MDFRCFMEASAFDEHVLLWGEMLGWTGRQWQDPRNQGRILAFSDYLKEHGFEDYGNLISCTVLGGFPQPSRDQNCDRDRLRATYDTIENYNFVRFERRDRGLLLGQGGVELLFDPRYRPLGRHNVFARAMPGRPAFLHPDDPERQPLQSLNMTERRLVVGAVLKRFAYFWIRERLETEDPTTGV